MKAIVTVIGKDQVGIIAGVCTVLAGQGINVLDISQTVMQEYFTMIMMVDTSGCGTSFEALGGILEAWSAAFRSAFSGKIFLKRCIASEVNYAEHQ